MYERLYNSLTESSDLTDEEWELCKTRFQPRKMRKRQFLLQQGDHCNRLAFIEKGALCSYSTDDKGNQHVLQFGFEGWWIADLYSFFSEKPSNLNIEVLEDCELLIIEREQHEFLLDAIPGFGRYNRILYRNAYVALQQRVENTLGLTADEKYTRFLDQYPFCLNRVPQHLIASFLGISPETLSRVRNQRAAGQS